MNSATFIISLDCEGKWGMADRIEPSHNGFLTTDNLEGAYVAILDLFKRFDAPATFAFVMAFTLSAEEARQHAQLFQDQDVAGDNWLRHFRRQIAEGNTEGWFAPRTLELVHNAGMHEIGCHGFCHLPLGDASVSRARAEIAAACTIARIKGIDLKTFIFPRNLVAHTDLLAQAGFAGFRDALHLAGSRARGIDFMSELNIRSNAQCHATASQEICAIPSGYFLNWRNGIRRIVPRSVTVARWRHIIDHAVRNRRVAHLWLHPHNILSGPGTLATLEEIVRHAAMRRDAGQLTIMTQRQYCAAVQEAA